MNCEYKKDTMKTGDKELTKVHIDIDGILNVVYLNISREYFEKEDLKVSIPYNRTITIHECTKPNKLEKTIKSKDLTHHEF